MLRVEHRVTGEAPTRAVVLNFTQRSKARVLVVLEDGTQAGIFQPRGDVLRHGDCLRDSGGGVVQVIAAAEELYQVRAATPFDLLRAAYHLGNRHVPVALSPAQLLLERDPVLRDLLLRLGLQVDEIVTRFDPEAGAYGGGHRHDHDARGGTLGEQLSREAHGDLSHLVFRPA